MNAGSAAGAAAASVRGWQQFWFRGIPPHIYALLRIVLGAVGVLTLLGLSDLDAYWDLDGIVPAEGYAALKAWAAASGMGTIAGRLLYVFSLLSFAAMTVGFKSSIAVPLAFGSMLLQTAWNYLPLSGAHDAMQGMLFCLMWSDTGLVWSVDAWRNRRRGGAATPTPQVSIAPLRLIRYQVALVYLGSGLWKLYSPLWREGEAVHYVLHLNVYHRFPDHVASVLEPFTVFATYTTLLWELAFAFMLLYRPTRRLALAAGVAIHLGMFALLEVGPFHLVMLSGYLAFLDPEWVAQGLRRPTGAVGRLARGSSPALTVDRA